MQYHVSIRSEPYGKYGYSIRDGRNATVCGVHGCKTLERAEHLARAAAERLIACDRLLGHRSHVETGAIEVSKAYAWRDRDGLWYVGDRDNAGTHRPGVSEACARYEAQQANERDTCAREEG